MYIVFIYFDHVIYLTKCTLPAHFRALPRHHLYTGSNGLNKVENECLRKGKFHITSGEQQTVKSA